MNMSRMEGYLGRLCRTVLATAVAAVALAGVGLGATPAEAALVLTIDDATMPGTEVSITDNQAGDLNLLPGVVLFNGGVGSFAVTITIGSSKPALTGNP